ncbi:glycosyltransferase [Flagellimonas sp. GZD32]|uniref:glycosyltransferase n=1 Tax=Flagellimonas cixiensis TaxID=3228750 RepID=UPI0035C918C0
MDRKIKNVYIIGNILGAYRSQIILSYLIDSSHYRVNFSDFSISGKEEKITIKILKLLDVIFASMFRLYFLIRADMVVVLPMNNNKIVQILTAKLFRKKIVADFYISYYETRVIDRKMVSNNSFKARLYRFYDLQLLKCKKVFFLNHSEAHYYINTVQKNKSFEVNSSILPLCMEAREPAQLNYFNNNSENCLRICWWGTFIPLHGLDSIIEAAAKTKKLGLNIEFHLFGDSEENAVPYLKMIEDLQVKDKVTLYSDYSFSNGKLERFLMENCDVALGAFGNTEKAMTVITNKLVDAISMKIPVVTCHSNGAKEYFFDTIDLFYSSNEPEELADTLLEISKKTNHEIHQLTNSAFVKFKSSFSKEAFVKKFQNELESI